jgi:type I restriction enzyme S subunit
LASIAPNGGFRHSGFKTYGGECPPKISLQPGDLYVSLKDVTQTGDLLGSIAQVPVDIPSGRLTQDTVKLVFDRAIEVPRQYVYWALRTPIYREYCRARATGTTTLGLAREDFLGFPLPRPSVEDLELVQLLGGLEERIALLRETNATLEAIAQALFKSWFVDFDPVRAKMEGRVPDGMDEATAALFPSDRSIWDQQVVRRQAAELVGEDKLLVGDGYRAKNDELGVPGVPFVRGGDLDQGQIVPTKDFLASASVKGARNKSALPGDTAFTSKGTIGRFAYVDISAGAAIYSPQVCFWRSLNHVEIDPTYLHYWMKSAAFMSQVDAVRGQAAIMDYVSLADQRRMKLDIPPAPIQHRFAEFAQPALEKMASNRASVSTLTAVRDTLLPRLISGQFRLPEAEALIEEVSA